MPEYDPEAIMSMIHSQVGGWFEAFVGSPYYEVLTEAQKDKAPDVTRFFAEYSFKYIGAAPEHWTQAVLRECCLEVLPGKVSAGPAFFEAVAPVLSAFFSFLAETGFLPSGRELAVAVAELEDEILAASQDERNWGPAKALVMAAEKAGVNTCNQQAMNLFMIEYNLRQIARMEGRGAIDAPAGPSLPAPAMPIRHSQPKPGRNDPCPCGSGKKFKKCCGR